MTVPHVLIVDDDGALLDALPETLRLRMDPIAVDVADSGAAALARIRATDYDAIIADIRMPGMDGLGLLDEIRAVCSETPTLLITGHGEHELAIEALRRGAYDYIQKPIDRDYFVASLRRAIERRQLARQVEEQRRALQRHSSELEERVRALTEAASAIHQARGVREVLEAVTAVGSRLVGGSAFVHVPQEQGPAAPAGPPEGVRALFEAALARRRIVQAEVTGGGDDGGQSPPRGSSWLVAPMIGPAGTVLGAIGFAHHDPGRLTGDLWPQVEALARQAAVALENALQYERQRSIAETLQFSLLPEHLPVIPGVTLAARYLPGTTEAVGGDWYDVFPLSEGRVGMVMGDVAGRGVRAAALMGQLRNALRAYALEGHGPGEVCRHLRRVIDPGQMATVTYLLFDPQSGALRYANLGHPPPIVVSPGRDAIFLNSTDPPLGAGVGGPVAEETVSLPPGSTLLLYTDGLIEVRGESLDEGFTRLRQAAVAASGAEPDLEAVLARVMAGLLQGRSPEDDVALLAIRQATLDPARLALRLPAVASSSLLLRRTLDRWLRGLAAAPDEAYAITVAASEAFANAVEHAYGPGDAAVDVEATARRGTVEITVRDSGRWRDPRGDSGRGLMVMRGVMETLDVIRGPAGTTVRMRTTLRRAAPHRPVRA